ncbi:unnamed protein product [Schistosoma mattheei]|uniref:Uncharacterized protein n=1 Tax=Schistosoma mattheei TaxID=31246 RepID=A0A183PSQ3_9TREM|nr:unnamed protein product [Schistosoma mattheei]
MLLSYDFNIKYQSTNTIGQADALSRLIGVQHPGPEDIIIASTAVDPEIRSIVADAIRNTPVSSDEVREETLRDPTLQEDTPIPKQLRPLAYRVDNFGIQIVNSFRRFPVIRLTVIIYLIILHLSIIIVSFMPVDNMNKKTVAVGGSSKLVIENPPVEANRLPHVLNKP